MRSVQIVVDPPVFNNVPGMAIAAEQMLVEAFISQSSIEAFDKSILHRLARGDVVPFHASILLPFEHGV